MAPFCVVLFCVFCILVVLVRLSVPVQAIDWKDSSPKWNVDTDVKPYSVTTHSLACRDPGFTDVGLDSIQTWGPDHCFFSLCYFLLFNVTLLRLSMQKFTLLTVRFVAFWTAYVCDPACRIVGLGTTFCCNTIATYFCAFYYVKNTCNVCVLWTYCNF